MPIIEDVAASSVTTPPVGTDKVGASFNTVFAVMLTVSTLEVVAIPSVAEILTRRIWSASAVSFNVNTPL